MNQSYKMADEIIPLKMNEKAGRSQKSFHFVISRDEGPFLIPPTRGQPVGMYTGEEQMYGGLPVYSVCRG